jgi:hypothetical protein
MKNVRVGAIRGPLVVAERELIRGHRDIGDGGATHHLLIVSAVGGQTSLE